MRPLLPCAALVALAACKPAPPDAPEGAEEGTRFLMRSFYADDATVGAGLTGLMNWYDDEGAALDGESPDIANDEAADFQLSPLAAGDLAPTQVSTTDRALDVMTGVMAVSTVGCSFAQAEALGGRADQDVVFEGEWAHYTRTYLTDRGPYDAATSGEIPPIDVALDPLEADFEGTAGALMLTSNALGTSEFGVDLDYTLNLHFRHGTYLVQDQERRATVILTWQPASTTGAGGSNSLHQTWGIDALVEVDGGVRRFAATWNDIESAATGSDLLVRLQVNRINRFAERMTALCADMSQLPAE
jgi:hypothetical protein